MIAANPYVKVALSDENFCSFCVVETHIKTAIINNKIGQKGILPLSVIILINMISDKFEIG